MFSISKIFSINKMAELNYLTWEANNNFIPTYIPSDLKWYEKDGLETWYLQKKCEEFLDNTYLHFGKAQIVNFDMINNEVDQQSKKQYQTIDHDKIKQYPVEF